MDWPQTCSMQAANGVHQILRGSWHQQSEILQPLRSAKKCQPNPNTSSNWIAVITNITINHNKSTVLDSVDLPRSLIRWWDHKRGPPSVRSRLKRGSTGRAWGYLVSKCLQWFTDWGNFLRSKAVKNYLGANLRNSPKEMRNFIQSASLQTKHKKQKGHQLHKSTSLFILSYFACWLHWRKIHTRTVWFQGTGPSWQR